MFCKPEGNRTNNHNASSEVAQNSKNCIQTVMVEIGAVHKGD